MNKDDITVVICCAGMGTRLGIGTTKALVDICGKPLIIRQLELLKEFNDIRIVVGFQAERVIDVVNNYRKDIMYAFNYNYKTTGVADSLLKGIIGARKYTLSIDGDLLINKNDLEKVINFQGECIAASIPNSQDPVLIQTNEKNQVTKFSANGTLEWTGLAKLETKHIKSGYKHVYEIIETLLPIEICNVRTREIDTQEDYDITIEWFNKGCTEM